MSKQIAYGLFISFLITGLFLGIQIKTGLDISPESITGQFINAISKAIPTQIPSQNLTFSILTYGLVVVGIVSIVADILLLLAYGKVGIIIGVLGFAGGASLIFFTLPALVIIIIGAMLAHFVDSYSQN